MGNSVSRVVGCFIPVGNEQDRVDLVFSGPLDEGLGHSFCYVRPGIDSSSRFSPSQSDRFGIDPDGLDSESHSRSFRFAQQDQVEDSQRPKNSVAETTFKAISGASVSANTSTPRTVVAAHDHQYNSFANGTHDRAAAFESTSSFSALPLQPVPRGIAYSGPMSGPLSGPVCNNTAMDRGFMSAPLERGFMSGPLERAYLSGPLENVDRAHFSAPLGGSHHLTYFRKRRKYFARVVKTVSGPVRKALSRTLSKTQRSWVVPVLHLVGWPTKDEKYGTGKENAGLCDSGIYVGYPSEIEQKDGHNLQWAQGKAGEDRVHVVLSEEHGWLFVGIYDGFNGPDAPDFLMSNLYKAIFNELEGLLWDQRNDEPYTQSVQQCPNEPEGPEAKEDNPADEHSNASRIEEDDVNPVPIGDRDNPCSKKPETDTEGSQCGVECDAKAIGSEGNSLPLTGFIKRVTFQSEKKAGGEIRRGRPLRELLAEEEDDTLDLFLWNPTAATVDNPNSRSLVPTADDSISALEGTAETRQGNTREGNGASGQVSGALTRRVTYSDLQQKQGRGRSLLGSKLRQGNSKRKESHRKLFPWRYDWERERIEVEKKLDERLKQDTQKCKAGAVDHVSVLKALARALEATEEAYLEMTDKVLDENPELALMGSCLLVMLMKDQDVYVMNVGDSRAIVAQHRSDTNSGTQQCSYHRGEEQQIIGSRASIARLELEGITEESLADSGPMEAKHDSKGREMDVSAPGMNLTALQLSTDHSTSIEEVRTTNKLTNHRLYHVLLLLKQGCTSLNLLPAFPAHVALAFWCCPALRGIELHHCAQSLEARNFY